MAFKKHSWAMNQLANKMQLPRSSLGTISSRKGIRLVNKEMLARNEQKRKEWSRDKKLRNANRDKRPDLRKPL